MYDVCIYHKNCYDGFTCAWLANGWNPQIELVAVDYGDNVEASVVADKHVLIADFSFPEETLRDMIRVGAKTVTVLDHHKSAEAQLDSLIVVSAGTHVLNAEEFQTHCEIKNKVPIRAWFDMSLSGAQLTLNALLAQYGVVKSPHVPSDEARLLIDYIADRDLWKWELPHSKEVNAWIMSHDFELSEWTVMFGTIFFSVPDFILGQGKGLLRNHELMVKRIADDRSNKQNMVIAGHMIPVTNCSYVFTSELGNLMAQRALDYGDHAFAASYVDGPDGRRFSLRSIGDFDVADIASKYGKQFGTTGGGHKNAAGFLAPHGWAGDTPSELENLRAEYNAALDFAIDGWHGPEFLKAWQEGDWKALNTYWPEWNQFRIERGLAPKKEGDA